MLRIYPIVLEVLKQWQPLVKQVERRDRALGSARETLACLEVAAACGYVAAQALPEAELSRMVGTLVKLVE